MAQYDQRRNPSSDSNMDEIKVKPARRRSTLAPQNTSDPRRTDYIPPSTTMAQEPSSKSQPIREAVSSAFSEAGASGQVHDPDLVAAITQQVIQNLKLSGIGSPTSAAVFQNVAMPPDNIPPRNVYTPPSPERQESSLDESRHTSKPLDYEGQNYRPSFEMASTPPPSKIRDETPRPAAPETILVDDTTTLEKIWQPLFDKSGRPTTRLGQFLRGLAIHIIDDFEPRRSLVIAPHKMQSFYEQVRMSNERYPWNEIFGGKLKHSDLSHVYRDLDCEHHFVQPSKPQDKPSAPALTPVGFERWMTLMILSNPDLEYDRLTKATLNMPISNADDVKERFPKELTRRLFPKQADHDSRMLLDDSIYADGDLTHLPDHPREHLGAAQSTSASAPAPSSASNSNPQSVPAAGPSLPPQQFNATPVPPQTSVQQSSMSKPMAPPPSSMRVNTQSAVDKDRDFRSAPEFEAAADGSSVSQPIERQRKPYSAHPGGGKVYEDGESRLPKGETSRNEDARPHKSDAFPHRQSTSSTGIRMSHENLDDYGVPHRMRSESATAQPVHIPPKRRYRSPSASNPYSRSDSNVAPAPVSISGREDYERTDDDIGLRRYTSSDERQRRYRPADDYGNHAGRASYDDEPRRQSRYDYPPPPPPRYP